jgi:hypothetical protein
MARVQREGRVRVGENRDASRFGATHSPPGSLILPLLTIHLGLTFHEEDRGDADSSSHSLHAESFISPPPGIHPNCSFRRLAYTGNRRASSLYQNDWTLFVIPADAKQVLNRAPSGYEPRVLKGSSCSGQCHEHFQQSKDHWGGILPYAG